MQATENHSNASQRAIDAFLARSRNFLAPDPEISRSHHIAPRSAREEDVLRNPLSGEIYAEMRMALQASLDEAFNIAELTVATPAAQCGDMSTAIFTATGDISLVSTRGVAGFAASLHYPIRFIRKYFENDPSVGVRPGDAFLLNDCRYGGIHSPDQHLVVPVFNGEELIAWVGCGMHEGEVGAKVPGGMGPSIESKWDEGFKGSPIKIVENYRLRTDLVTLVQNNSREPQIILADIKARISASRRIEARLSACQSEYGVDAVIGCLRANIEFIRDETARRIAELPEGTVHVIQYVDNTMREPGLLKLSMRFTKRGERIIIDTRGSAPQLTNRPINSLVQNLGIGVLIAASYHLWPDLPPVQAVIDQFDFVTDPQSIVDCDNEVPTALNMAPAFKFITAMELAFARFYFGAPRRYAKVKGGWFNQPQGIIYGGINQHFDSVGNLCADLNAMAGGAKCDDDGEHSLAPSFGVYTDCGEAELAEEGLPFVYAIGKKLWPDNCGFGKYRGGAAYQYGLMRFGALPFGFQTFSGGSHFPATMGLFGGYACPTYAVCRVRGINLFEELKKDPTKFSLSIEDLMNNRPFEGAQYTSHEMAVPFEFYPEGELFMLSQGAGGGYGDVLERDPERVITDLEEGLISHRTAQDIYCVRYHEETLALDVEATEAARSAEREARKSRGLTWDAFIDRHVRPEPPEGIMYLGSWNDGTDLYDGQGRSFPPGQVPPIFLPDPLMVENLRLKTMMAAMSDRDAVPTGASHGG